MENHQEQAANPPATPRMESQEEKRPRANRRAREVSSRYMMMVKSPISSSSSSAAAAASPSSSSCSSTCGGDQRFSASSHCAPLPPPLPPKKHLQKQRNCPYSYQQPQIHSRRSPSPTGQRCNPPVPLSPDVSDSETDGSCFGDENQPDSTTLSRSLDTPMPMAALVNKAGAGTQRKRAVSRLFRENGEEQPKSGFEFRGHIPRHPRPGTPMAQPLDRTSTIAASTTPRPTVPSRNQPRLTTKRASMQLRRSAQDTPLGRNGASEVLTPARSDPSRNNELDDSRSIDTESSSLAEFSEAETCGIGSQGGWCDSPPIRAQGSRVRSTSECRSSMPEVDHLPTMSGRRFPDASPHQMDSMDGGTSHRGTPSFCHRSLNSALSSFQQTVLRSSGSLKSHQSLAQQTPIANPRLEAKKVVRKGVNRQEDAHVLRLLENRYLQWRLVNAKAQAAAEAQRVAAEKSLYGLSAKLVELRSSVSVKKSELERLKSIQILSYILEAEMPYLEEWMLLEADHSDSLCGAIKALDDASLRLPLIGNVKANVMELSEILGSATNVMEALSHRVGCFLPLAEGIDNVISDLARVVCEERALVEECGVLLSEVQRLQVSECSLRGQLMQLKKINSLGCKTEC